MATQSFVYVVDDDASVRKSLERLLRTEGLEVKTFASARDFLLEEIPGPACLLLDIEMPEITGLELQKELTARNQSLPIIFITGFGNVPKSVQAMKAGAFDFLEKPFEAAALIDTIHRAINHDFQVRERNRDFSAMQQRMASLTNREREVFELVVTGMLNKQIAFQLGIAEKTIKVHRARVMQKVGAQSLAELVRLAERLQ